MSVRGEVALPELIGKLTKLADGHLLIVLSHNLAEQAIELTKQGFEDEEDPFGSPWAPIKRSGKILQDTARLKNSFAVGRIGTDGFTFGSNVVYAGFHQTGTSKMPRRMMVPERELPRDWATSFQDAAEEVLIDFMKT